MNTPALTIGIAISILIITRFKKAQVESNKFTYPLLLFTFPLYYLVFAVFAHDYKAIPLELLAGLIFFVIPALSIALSNFYKFCLLGFGYLLHGVYDVTHHWFFINAGTPEWWPEFCGIIDITLGFYLFVLANKMRQHKA